MPQSSVTYPCQWSFTLIGSDATAVQDSVEDCLKSHPYDLKPSNKSRTGKYVSLHLETPVASEDERNRLFACLKAAPSIKMIL